MARDREDLEAGGQLGAEAREYAAGKKRERGEQTRMATTRAERPPVERPDNPLTAHERHRAENAAGQQTRLQGIADPERRDSVTARIENHYTAWGKALKKAYAQRYDNSDRIYERKLAERKTDVRLIPKDQKDDLRKEAIRESVAQSNNRIKEINDAIPQMIDKAISDAAKLPAGAQLDKDTQRAKDTAAAYARAARSGHNRDDRDHER
jgi:phosphoenolpyruvate-protein kinase (PTS system EI component)